MRVLFVHYGTFDSNSAIQTFHFANALTERGIDVAVCGRAADRLAGVGEPRFEHFEYPELGSRIRRYRADRERLLVHAWTPRERVREATARVVGRLGAPYVVHLEDNEEHLIESMKGLPFGAMGDVAPDEQDSLAGLEYVHPTRYPEFMRGAAGVTVITSELGEFNFGGRPQHLMRPGIDAEQFSPDVEPAASRGQLGIGPDAFVLVYHGAMHFANEREMFSLYLAVNLLRRRGHDVVLVRVGENWTHGIDPSFGALLDRGSIELGAVPWRDVPGYLALADAFVQPGAPDEFNRYRLPSKLPEFLAMGRPVVLPDCNLGAELHDGEQALLLQRGDGAEIAERVESLIADPELARALGEAARKFALNDLDWGANAATLADFYRRILRAQRNGGEEVDSDG